MQTPCRSSIRACGLSLLVISGVVALQPLVAANAGAAAGNPVPLIFDTDIGNDVDDALALGVIHALASRNECRLIAALNFAHVGDLVSDRYIPSHRSRPSYFAGRHPAAAASASLQNQRLPGVAILIFA